MGTIVRFNMKAFAPVLTALFMVVLTVSIPRRSMHTQAAITKTGAPEQLIDFAKQVLPIMVSNCSPCHFTGGKMYRLLPFDKDTTIIHHGEKILPRISKKEEHTMLKDFLQQQKNTYNGRSLG